MTVSNSWSVRSAAAITTTRSSWTRLPTEEALKVRSGKSRESVYPLIKLCAQLLTDKPLFFLVNSYTTGLQPAVLRYMIATALENMTEPSPQMRLDCRCPPMDWCCLAGQADGLRGNKDYPDFYITFSKGSSASTKVVDAELLNFYNIFFFRSTSIVTMQISSVRTQMIRNPCGVFANGIHFH